MAIVISDTECSWDMCHPGSDLMAERVAMAERDRQEIRIILSVYPYNKLRSLCDGRQEMGDDLLTYGRKKDRNCRKVIHMIE